MPVSKSSLLFKGPFLVIAASALLVAGCASKSDPTTTGSISRSAKPTLGDAVEQARQLRTAGKTSEAVALLKRATARDPKSKALALAYGRALADAGQNEAALAALAKARSGGQTDWIVLNTQGALLDRMGRTDEAQKSYQAALALSPEEPSVLSNLGLSLALSQQPAEAEAVLRRAAEQPGATVKIRQNLALVLALQGKFKEAEDLARRDLPPEEVAANMRYWKQSLKPAAAKPVKQRAPAKAPTPAPQQPAFDEPLGLRG